MAKPWISGKALWWSITRKSGDHQPNRLESTTNLPFFLKYFQNLPKSNRICIYIIYIYIIIYSPLKNNICIYVYHSTYKTWWYCPYYPMILRIFFRTTPEGCSANLAPIVILDLRLAMMLRNKYTWSTFYLMGCLMFIGFFWGKWLEYWPTTWICRIRWPKNSLP